MSQIYPEDGSNKGLPKGFVYLGGQVLPEVMADNIDQILNWQIKDDVVWICSLPKTGTTWTQEMVWMIMNDLDFEKGKIIIDKRSPYVELSYLRSNKYGDQNNLPAYRLNSVQYAKEKSAEDRAPLKTHLCWNLLPKEIQNGTKKPKIVYVFRNPKDSCVSLYYYSKLFSGHSKSLEEFSESFLAGTRLYLPYWSHVLPFWERRHQPNILFIRYEDMIKDLPAVIRQVAKFLDKSLTDDQVNVLTDHLSFSNMKNNPATNKEDVINRMKEVHSTEGTFMRKGKAGGYKDEMSEEMIRKFDEWIKGNNEGIDLST